jgi:2-iminoacetate synthase ThiH
MKIGDFKKEVLNKIRQDIDYEEQFPIDDYEMSLEEVLNIDDEKEMSLKDIEDELKNAQEYFGEHADSLVDVYTRDLLYWYAEDVNRIAYMEDAIKELGAQEAYQILSGGQYLYWEEVLNEVIEAGLGLVQTEDNETEEDEEE